MKEYEEVEHYCKCGQLRMMNWPRVECLDCRRKRIAEQVRLWRLKKRHPNAAAYI